MACEVRKFSLTWKFCAWIFFVFLYVLPFVLFEDVGHSVDAQVTQRNNFVILKTRDSGTFVGTKVPEPEPAPAVPEREQHSISNSSTDSIISTSESVRVLVSGSDIIENPKKADLSVGAKVKPYYAFKGIPYAKPPLGNLRWREPQPPDVKAGPTDTTRYKSVCSYWDSNANEMKGSQDCLYLNIFTPRLHFLISRTSPDEISPYDDDPRQALRLLPVLIYIHASEASSDKILRINPQRITQADVLLITFSYRTGIFGFLSSGDEGLTGNYGLHDQLAAIVWLKKNIHRFGGDPARMTIFGEVAPLLITPLAPPNLYQGAVIMGSSASVFNPGFFTEDPAAVFEKVASKLGCEPGDTEELLNDCFRIRPVEELLQLQQDLYKFSTYPKTFGVVLDNFSLDSFFPETPENLTKSNAFIKKKVQIMVGVNSAEGFRVYQEFYKSFMEDNDLTSVEGQKRLKGDLHAVLQEIQPNLKHQAVFDQVWNFYFGRFNGSLDMNSEEFQLQMIQLFGDTTTYTAHHELLQILAKKKTLVFNYVFDYKLDQLTRRLEDADETRTVNDDFLPWEEEYYLLGSDRDSLEDEDATDSDEDEQLPEPDPADDLMIATMVRVWTSFAAYRTPKNAVAKLGHWSRWDRLNLNQMNVTNFYHITKGSAKMFEGFKEKEASFWLESVPELHAKAEIEKPTILKAQGGGGPSTMLWILIALIAASVVLIIIVGVLTCKML